MKRMLKPTIISIAMATVMAGAAISPALGLIAEYFSDADPILIKLVLTVPSLMIIPFSFISSYLTRKISKRTIVLLGLAIYVISGVGAQFANTIEVLLAFRIVLGAGVGLVMPLSFTLISDHFQGKDLTKMMGYNTAFSNIGGIITMLLAGYLATYNWRVPFNVYWMGVGIFILVLMYLPKNEPIKQKAGTKRARMPMSILGYALAAGGVMLAYYAVATNMALYLQQSGLGGSGIAGLVISFTTVGGMITSLTLVRLQFFFKEHLMTAALLSMGVAFGILTISQSVPVILISVCMVGFGQGIVFPLINDTVLGNIDRALSDRVISIVSSMIYVGQFLSPVVLDSLGKMVGNTEIRFQYSVLSVSLLVSVAVMVALKLIKRNRMTPEAGL